MATNFVQSNTLYLSGSGVLVGATSITLTTFTDIYANVLTMADFGSKGYITLEPDTTNEEAATFTGVVANANGTYTLTGVKTVLAKSPYTETSGLIRAHAGGTKLVVTDNVAFWNTFLNIGDAETVTGIVTFATGATPLITDQPTTNLQAANKLYVDTVTTSGAPNASDVTKGITKLSVAPVSPTSPIAVGDNDTRVPTAGQAAALPGNNTDIAVGSGNKYVTQTGLQHNAEKYAADTSGSTTAYVVTLSPVPTSLTAGMIVYAKIVSANTTTTPTLNVNSLGAKTIVKLTNTALAVGDIGANQLCTFQYDGTNFVMISPVATLPQYKNGTTTRVGDTASGTQNIAHGLGIIPKYIRITVRKSGNAGNTAGYLATSDGVHNGTTTSCVYSSFAPGSGAIANITGVDNTNVIYIGDVGSNTNLQVATVTNDSTNIILSWTKTGSPQNYTINILWEAFA